MEVGGLFVAIGHTPNTGFLERPAGADAARLREDAGAVAHGDQRGGGLRRGRRDGRLLPPGDHRRRHRLHGRAGGGALAGAPRLRRAEPPVLETAEAPVGAAADDGRMNGSVAAAACRSTGGARHRDRWSGPRGATRAFLLSTASLSPHASAVSRRPPPKRSADRAEAAAEPRRASRRGCGRGQYSRGSVPGRNHSCTTASGGQSRGGQVAGRPVHARRRPGPSAGSRRAAWGATGSSPPAPSPTPARRASRPPRRA